MKIKQFFSVNLKVTSLNNKIWYKNVLAFIDSIFEIKVYKILLETYVI